MAAGGRVGAGPTADQFRDEPRLRRRLSRVVGRHRLGLERQEEPDVAVRVGEDQAAVVQDAVVAGVPTGVALVEVDVVDAVQAVEVAELRVDRLVQVAVEFGAEREQLAARVLALLQVQDQQVLEVVGGGAAAG
nr:hypothetical protein GCM10020092_039780 [Actinoplanes digitatis]